jgi:MFS family permease
MTEQDVERRASIPVLASIGALRGAFQNIRGVIWQPFVLSLGVPMKSLGGLASLLSLTRIVVQPVVGRASDAYGRRRFIMARELLILLAGALLVFTRSWHLLLVVVVFLGLEQAIYPVWSTLVAESVDVSRLGYTYSVLGTSTTAAGLIASLSAGYVAEAYGYHAVFAIATGLAFVTFVIVLTRLAETMKPQSEVGIGWLDLASSLIDTLKPPTHLRGFYIAMAVDLIAFGTGYFILYGMLAKGYGYTPAMLGTLSAVTTGSMALFQVPVGRYADRVGYAKYLAISQAIACVVILLVIYSKQYEVVLFAQALLGFSASFWHPAEQAWIAKNVDPGERARAIGSYSTFRGLLSFPAPFIGGLLFDAYGFNLPMFINLVIALIDIVLILALVKD